jgi:type IV pilus assembly protein PilZ
LQKKDASVRILSHGGFSMAKNAKEKRKHHRKPVHIRIKYKILNQFFEDYIKNISLGGIFVETPDPLPVRTRLKVEFSLPEMEPPIETEGIVVHTIRQSGKPNAPISGMGIKFSDLNEESRRRLEAYITDNKVF